MLAPDIYEQLDFTQPFDSLEAELRKIQPEITDVGKRIVDKLLKVYTLPDGEGNRDERRLFVEAQGYKDDDFAGRVFLALVRILAAHGQPPYILIVLLDDDPKWLPSGFEVSLPMMSAGVVWVPVKILAWRDREDELKASDNPFALFMRAQLISMRTKKSPRDRATAKLDLIRELHAGKMDPYEYPTWYRYLDWLLSLPPELEKAVWDEIIREERERNPEMPYVTNAERFAEARGREAGELKGKLEGVAEGKLEGKRLSLLRVLSQPRLGKAPADIEALVAAQTDADALDRWLDLALSCASHDDFRAAVAPGA